ncbi:hypothetical protein [Spirosoma luteolum]
MCCKPGSCPPRSAWPKRGSSTFCCLTRAVSAHSYLITSPYGTAASLRQRVQTALGNAGGLG